MQLTMCKQIILTHVSPTNGYDYFSKRVYDSLGKVIPVKQLNATDIEITYIESKNKIQRKF